MPKHLRLLSLICSICLLSGCLKEDAVKYELGFSNSPTWSPDSPGSNEKVTITFTVSNSGDNATGTLRWKVSEDGNDNAYSGSVASVAVNGTATISFSVQKESGSHTFKIVIDSDNSYDESDEDNNSSSVTINWDGSSSSFAISSATIVSNSDGTATINLKLRNDNTSTRTIYYRILDDDANDTVVTGSRSTAGSTTTGTIGTTIVSSRKYHSFHIEIASSNSFSTILDSTDLQLSTAN
jgi:hypothetical protein